MKQTRSAINLLKAAYKAVYVKAFFKGLALTAVFATAANAAAIDADTSIDTATTYTEDTTLNGDITLTVNNTLTVDNGASLIVEGKSNGADIAETAGNIAGDGQIIINSGAKFIVAAKNYGNSGSYFSLPNILVNKGTVVIGDTQYSDEIISNVSINGAHVLEKDSFIFANDGQNRGNIVIMPTAQLSVMESNDSDYFNFSNVNLKKISRTDYENGNYSGADVYYVSDSLASEYPEDDDYFAHIWANNIQIDASEFDRSGLDLYAVKYKLQVDGNNTFTIKNGVFSTAQAPEFTNLNGETATIKLTGTGRFDLSSVPGQENTAIDFNNINLVVASENDIFSDSWLDLEDKYTNIGNIDINGGSMTVYESGDMTSAGKLTVEPKAAAIAYFNVQGGKATVAQLDVKSGAISQDALFPEDEALEDMSDDELKQHINSGLYVAGGGSFTVKGTDEASDVHYNEGSIKVQQGSSITFDTATLDGFAVDKTGALVIDDGFNLIQAEEGSTVNLNFADNIILTQDLRDQIKNKILGNSNATLSFGNAGLNLNLGEKDANGRYSYETFKQNNPTLDAQYTGSDLTGNAFTVKTTTSVEHRIGAAHSTDGNTVNVSGKNVGFVNAAVNNGYLASYGDTQAAADIAVADGAILTLENGGKAGSINSEGSAQVQILGSGTTELKDIQGGDVSIATAVTAENVNAEKLSITNGQLTAASLTANADFSAANAVVTAATFTVNGNATLGTANSYVQGDIGNLALGTNSFSLVGGSSDKATMANIKTVDDGNIIKGTVSVDGRAALGFGFDNLSEFNTQLRNGGLVGADGLLADNGSLLFIGKAITLDDGAKLSINGKTQVSRSVYAIIPLAEPTKSANIEIGANGQLVVLSDALKDGAAVNFNKEVAGVINNEAGSKVTIAGDIQPNKPYTIFASEKGVTAENDIAVSSSNGLFSATIGKDDVTSAFEFSVNEDTLNNAMGGSSAPVKKAVLSALNSTSTAPGAAFLRTYAGAVAADPLLADRAARLAVVSGTQLATIGAAQSSYEAIAHRLDNVHGSGIIASDNHGIGIWLNPIYKHIESDGFASQGMTYGSDIDLAGAALGADYTFANGLKLGAMFNLGTGSSDSAGVGSKVSNDFDYYGIGVYAGLNVNNFKFKADLSYTELSNDFDTDTPDLITLGKLSADTDSSALSFGIEGGYTFATATVDITPHVGLRYTALDTDDYTVKGADGAIVKSSFDTMNIFSIPVGVTFAKNFTVNDWTLSPQFDLELAANFGDTDQDYSAEFTGLDKINLESEIIDDFTYSATVGFEAQTGNFNVGLGVNYIGSDNTDSIGVRGDVSYRF
ncbi:autotransporter outer membrane beta-barrel domain-containing protein [Succinatimonas hippei]|uniref:autotransporter family protein n=1 Tax=Succinatimonas hippei TaxID=626938 RepID=UPI0026EF8E28|nr:autotransporter outer membrane beta-barrel domain-containing protein [Succinatimonas hippei]